MVSFTACTRLSVASSLGSLVVLLITMSYMRSVSLHAVELQSNGLATLWSVGLSEHLGFLVRSPRLQRIVTRKDRRLAA